MDFRKKLPFGGKSHYANELELSASRSRALSGPTKGSSHVKDNWSVGSVTTYWCNLCKTSEIWIAKVTACPEL